MGSHAAGRGAHAARGRAAQRRRRRRASRLATLGAAAVAGLAVLGVSAATGDGGAAALADGQGATGANPSGTSKAGGPSDPARSTGSAEAKDSTDGQEKKGQAESAAWPPRVTGGDTFDAATGRYAVASGSATAPGKGRVVRYLVEVEDGLGVKRAAFAADVHRILNSPGGWGHGGRTMRFERVASGPSAFRVALSSPELTDRRCAPLKTYGKVSCFQDGRAVINAMRWRDGAPTYGGDLARYREYVVNHEVGHALGHGHASCPKEGALAPIMVQQTKTLEGCAANPWPHPAP
jgi:hypothetical protein